MKLTIIPSDNFVSVDGIGYDTVDTSTIAPNIHAIQWFGEAGWIEYTVDYKGNKQANEAIYSIEQFQAVINSWKEVNYKHNNPPPEPPPTAENNKSLASSKLAITDWVEVPSVTNTSNTPYLINKEEFDIYRLWLRNFVVNPVGGDVEWPNKPTSLWSS